MLNLCLKRSNGCIGIYKRFCSIIANENIQFQNVRVVYKLQNGENKNEIMTREKALALANEFSLDLILVAESANPPVCKLESVKKLLQEKKQAEKERVQAQKARALKEMHFSAGIEANDLNQKTAKVIEFLSDGHQVKCVVSTKSYSHKRSPMALDKTTMSVLSLVEEHVATVSQSNAVSELKRDFILNPKPKKV